MLRNVSILKRYSNNIIWTHECTFHILPFIGSLLTSNISISKYPYASFVCTLLVPKSFQSPIQFPIGRIYFNRLQNSGAKLFRIWNVFICWLFWHSWVAVKGPLILTFIPVLTFAKCGVSRIPFLACTNVASRCISASCIFMTVATNTTLVQIYTGSVDKELKLNFFFALIHLSIFLINCEGAESYGFLEYIWLCDGRFFCDIQLLYDFILVFLYFWMKKKLML